jgi:hypothetical protein
MELSIMISHKRNKLSMKTSTQMCLKKTWCDTVDTSFSTTILLCKYFWSIMAWLISPTLYILTFLFLKLKLAGKIWRFHVSRIQE